MFRLLKVFRQKPGLVKRFGIKKKVFMKGGSVLLRALDIVTLGAIGYDLIKGDEGTVASTSDEQILAFNDESSNIMTTVYLPEPVALAILSEGASTHSQAHILGVAAIRAASRTADDMSQLMAVVYAEGSQYVKLYPGVDGRALEPETALANIKQHFEGSLAMSNMSDDAKNQALSGYSETYGILKNAVEDETMDAQASRILDWYGYLFGRISEYYFDESHKEKEKE